MSEQEPKIEEAREIIKVRRISAKPKDPEKKNDEVEAAKARQAELEKRLRRLQLFLSGVALTFFLLGLRVLGCFTFERSPRVASPQTPPLASVGAAGLPSRPRQNDVAPQQFRRLFTSEPGDFRRANGDASSTTPFEPSASAASFSPSNDAPHSSPSLDDLRVVRVAVWNLEPFNFSKVNDASVGEKIARLLQEFDVVAVQGVRSKNRAVLEALVYLIDRQGGKYDYVASSPASVDAISAFFFNAQTVVVDRESVSDVFDARGRLPTPALVANFRPNAVAAESSFTFQLINVRLLGTESDGETLADLLATLKKRAGAFGVAEDDLIVAGDFGAAIQKIKGVEKIPNAATLHREETTDVDGGNGANLLFDSVATIEYVERFGVVDLAEYFNISDAEAQKIARGRPVWGDFSVYEGGDPHFFAPSEKK